jgi:hypothetical protein
MMKKVERREERRCREREARGPRKQLLARIS